MPCVAVIVYLRRGVPAHASFTDQLLEVLDDADLHTIERGRRRDLRRVALLRCLGLEWLGRTAYDERIANGVKRDGKILLGYDEDPTASESCVYDFAHVIGGEGFAPTRAEIRTPYVVVHVTQCPKSVCPGRR